MLLLWACQQQVHGYSLCFYSLPSQSETLSMSSAPLPLDQTHWLLYWFKGTEQCHVLLCPGGRAALQMILGDLELSFSIIYSDPLSIFYLFTTILFTTKCKPWELLPYCFLQSHMCTSGCAEITRHSPLLILKASLLALRIAFSPCWQISL